MRGTVGVGGQWPALSYANAAARDADTSQAANTYAWLLDTGNVYRWVASAWVQQTSYYIAKAIPKALVTTITDIDGLVLTLADDAVVTATNAGIHYDNAAIFNTIGAQGSGATPLNNTLYIPSGSFAISEYLMIQGHDDWILTGAHRLVSKIFSPKGVASANLLIHQCDGLTVKDFHLQGNANPNGFGLLFGPGGVTETEITQGDAYPRGVQFHTCDGGSANDMKMTDIFHASVGTSYCTDVWARRCLSLRTVGLQVYMQWDFLWADSTGGGTIDCETAGPILNPSFSMFRSDGVSHIRPVTRNGVMESNSCGNFLFDAPTIVTEAQTQHVNGWFTRTIPCININSNIEPPSPTIEDGGTIRNVSISQLGTINANDDILPVIVINALCPNVVIEGGYPSNPELGGLISGPDFVEGGLLWGGVAVLSDNAAVDVTGIRAIGRVSEDYANIYVATGSTVTDCVADEIFSDTQTNNQTNAEYEWAGVYSLDFGVTHHSHYIALILEDI